MRAPLTPHPPGAVGAPGWEALRHCLPSAFPLMFRTSLPCAVLSVCFPRPVHVTGTQMFHVWFDGKKVKFPATWNICAHVASSLSLQAAGSPFIPKYPSDSSGGYVGKIAQPVAMQYQYPQMQARWVPSTAPQTALPATQTPGPPVAERCAVRQAHESSVAHLGPGSGGSPSVSASCVSCPFRTPGRFRECPGPEAWTPAQNTGNPVWSLLRAPASLLFPVNPRLSVALSMDGRLGSLATGRGGRGGLVPSSSTLAPFSGTPLSHGSLATASRGCRLAPCSPLIQLVLRASCFGTARPAWVAVPGYKPAEWVGSRRRWSGTVPGSKLVLPTARPANIERRAVGTGNNDFIPKCSRPRGRWACDPKEPSCLT